MQQAGVRESAGGPGGSRGEVSGWLSQLLGRSCLAIKEKDFMGLPPGEFLFLSRSDSNKVCITRAACH